MMSSSASWCSSSETQSSAGHSTSRPGQEPHRSPSLRRGCPDPRQRRLPEPGPTGASSDSPRQDPPAGTPGTSSARAPHPASPGPSVHHLPGSALVPSTAPAPLTAVLLLQVADLRVLLRQHHVRPQPGRVRGLRRGARALPRRHTGVGAAAWGLPGHGGGSGRPARAVPSRGGRSPGRRSPRPPPAWRPRAGAARPTGR